MSAPAKNRWFGVVVFMLVCAGGGLGLWHGLLKDQVVPRNFGIVEEGHAYRSARLTPGVLHRLRDQYGIKTVIDLGAFDKDPIGERTAARTAQALSINRFVFPLEGDGRGNPNAYVAALRVLNDPAAHPVLICCSAGAQRTSACVMLYQQVLKGRPIEQSYPESFAFGHDPDDNTVLRPYLDEWADDIERAFRAGGNVPGFPTLIEKPAAILTGPQAAAVKPVTPN